MKEIEGSRGYYSITRDGQVWSHRNGRFLKNVLNNTGYLCVNLPLYKKRQPRNIHRLLAYAYISNPLGLRTVNHKNGNKTDNRLENLEWCSHKENTLHAFRIGLMTVSRGSKISTKLNEKDIPVIRTMRRLGFSNVEIGKKFRIDASVVSRIVNRKRWQHVQ